MKNYSYVDEEECYFRMSPDYMAVMAQKLDITIRPYYYSFLDAYPVGVMIKYNKSRLKNPITQIEMIEMLALFKVSFVSFMGRRVVIDQIYASTYNYQISCINLDITCY